jgi:hypothetical protein
MINFLINIENLKGLGLIHNNVDTKIVSYTMRVVQDQYVRDVVGVELYNELLRRVEANEWTAPYTKLMDEYISKVIVSWCNYRVLNHLNNSITNKGAGRNNDPVKQSNDFSENNQYKNDLIKDANFYSDRLHDFLEDNASDYPEYDAKCKQQNKISPLNWLKV